MSSLLPQPSHIYFNFYRQVITTYDTLASDFLASGGEESFGAGGDAAGAKRKRRHGVLALGWHRVVLDEAHTIRNSKTRKHKVG